MARSPAMLLALLLVPACAPAAAVRCPEPPPVAMSLTVPPAKAVETPAVEAAPDDTTLFRLTITVKPVVDPAALAEVEIAARGPASDLDTWTIAAPSPGSVRSISARDIDGPIAVTTTEGPSSPAPLQLQLARPPLGVLHLAYSVTAKPNSLSTSPAVELDPDRFRAQGDALIAVPDAADQEMIAVSLTIDPSDLGESIRAASSLGVGSPREAKVKASDIRQMLLLAGHMGTAVFKAAEGHDESAWVGYTTFDPRPIAADVASFRTAVGQVFHEPIPSLSTLMITADGRQPGAFVAARRAGGVAVNVSVGEPWSAPVRIAVASEIIKAWIGERLWIGPAEPERDAEAFWFTEGVTRHLARDLLFRFGLISASELLDEVNGLEALLATSPLKGESNTSLAKRIQEPGALPLLTARGALYATRVDALLRKKHRKSAKTDEKSAEIGSAKTDEKSAEKPPEKPPGKRVIKVISLDTLLSVLYATAREQRGPLPTSAWTGAIAKELDQAEADTFTAMIEKGKDVRAPDGALGPCFKGGPRRYEPFDLGFDREATRKTAGPGDDAKEKVVGVRAGGPAAKAGLRDGDSLLDAKITLGRSDVPVTLTIERDGAKRSITYRPGGPAASGHGWSRLKDVPDEACTQ